MNDFDKQKWPAMVFFSISSLIFLVSVWYLFTGALNPEYYWQSSETLALESPEPLLKKEDPVVLAKNQGAQVGDTRIVYRGSRGGNLHMDLYILQLDPHYGYPHSIEEAQARKGFRMGEYHFKVLVASDNKISLKRL